METLLTLALALALTLLVFVAVKWFLSARQARRRQVELDAAQSEIARLSAAYERLRKWEAAEDAAGKAAELERLNKESVASAKAEAKRLLDKAERESDEARSEARRTMDSATTRAVEIVRAAEARAQEIAGDAYKAMNNAALYEKTARAMKNIVEGYGDEYLVPPESILDDLAEEFSHADAGQRLKLARETTRAMVRNGTAGTCEYVEVNKRDTAIRFVVDAFTGRVDSILSLAKDENSGKLEQEIRDAFATVNFTGKAFRDARVTDAFLAARLDELKWAAITHQLRLEEREEQRVIKERMRDEERARRDIEKALKEAARDEDLIRKATEKVQAQLESASAEQKQKYELQLAELSRKLAEVEAKGQRAISMAQQTKRGFVYVISNVGSFGDNVFKIGLTRRLDPLDRVRELGDSSVPFEFDVHAMLFSENAPALEYQLHKHFLLGQINKVNRRKEFFRAEVGQIRKEIEDLGLTGHWTMKAVAQEYRESLAIERKINADPVAREAWINRQLELSEEDLKSDLLEPEKEAA